MAKSSLVLGLWLSVCLFVNAQDGRYVVLFTDKANTSFTLDNPLAYLSQKSIDRRARNGVVLTEEDFPVNPAYAEQVSTIGATILYGTRWLNGVVVDLDAEMLPAIEGLPFVHSVEFVAPSKPPSGGRQKQTGKKKDSNVEAANQLQLAMLGINDMHADNVFGEGITIGVFDSGFIGVNTTAPFQALFDEGRIQLSLDMVGFSGNVFQYDDHGTEVLSIMAAKDPAYQGGVYLATYQLYVTEDVSTEFRIEEYNWLVAAEKADSAGVDIIHASVGYNVFDDPSMDYAKEEMDGKTAIVSQAAAKAFAKGMAVVVSAGNEGNNAWQLVTAPADAAGVLAIGSITGTGNLSSFSSVGPTADGRIKPDLVALGSGTSVVKSNGTIGTASGTSFSAPLVSSLAAGLLEAFPDVTVAMLYEALLSTASLGNTPNNQMGFGIPDYRSARDLLSGGETTDFTSSIVLYPNPATSNVIKINIDVPIGREATIRIYGMDGKLVYTARGLVANLPMEIDLSLIASGLYLVKIESEGAKETLRLVKL